MNYTINICGETYEVLDALTNITMADSFVKNKIGGGHGEAKLYVGNYNDRYTSFFDNLNRDWFFLKSDFEKYLFDARDEFLDPQQEYVKKSQMPQIYSNVQDVLNQFKDDILLFSVRRVNVEPPRVYLISNSEYYDYLRAIGLPNLSYLSILKIKSKAGIIYYYCLLFLTYKPDIIKYETPAEKAENDSINNKNLSPKQRTSLIQSRIGQGQYRERLLEECPFCPFTLVNDERLLIASNIKPWPKSSDKEKVDPKIGFNLTPNFDKLFDQGFITFSPSKLLIVSPWISPMNQKRLGIYNGKYIDKLPLDSKREVYMKYHRDHIYKG